MEKIIPEFDFFIFEIMSLIFLFLILQSPKNCSTTSIVCACAWNACTHPHILKSYKHSYIYIYIWMLVIYTYINAYNFSPFFFLLEDFYKSFFKIRNFYVERLNSRKWLNGSKWLHNLVSWVHINVIHMKLYLATYR